ncbi:MAG: pur operon repressor [Anaerovorax sp.]
MTHLKRVERVGALIKILSDSPSKLFTLSYFCKLFSAAKSSVSEDIQMAKSVVSSMELGFIETVPGAGGGVRFVPHVTQSSMKETLDLLCQKLNCSNRILGGGFLYTSDIMFDPRISRQIGQIFATQFKDVLGDYVVTIETKGIPVALMTAQMLNLPLVVLRRESKISEGSTVSINYFAGSSERIQKMSVSKRALVAGSKAIVIDDFMRAGGSIRGISDMLTEFDVEVSGIGVVISSIEPKKKKVKDYIPLLYLGNVDEETKRIQVYPNIQIFQKK